MPKINLKQVVAAGRSVTATARGALEEVAGAAGKGGISVNAGPNGISISANFNQLLKKKLSGNKITTPLKDLYKSNGGKINRPIIFPQDLDDEHYIIFNVMERKKQNRASATEERAVRSIVLPVPSNLQVQYGVEYANEGLGLFGAMASGAVNAADVSSAAADIGSAISNKVQQASAAFKSGDMDAAVQAAGIAAPGLIAAGAAKLGPAAGLLALGGTSGGVISGVSVSEGVAVNPHMAVLFKGVGFKEHSFSYRFIARNQQESEAIQQMIQVFKYHMHPNYVAGSLAFEYPEEFEIEFASAIKPYLYKIGTCVLQNFSVNYNGENTPLFFETTGAPVVVDISLSFQEIRIITKDDMDDPNVESPLEQTGP